jgi:hypothetical protein
MDDDNTAAIAATSRLHMQMDVQTTTTTTVEVGGYAVDLRAFCPADASDDDVSRLYAAAHSRAHAHVPTGAAGHGAGGSTLVLTRSTVDVIHRLVQALLLEVPIIVQGDVGCGKSFVIREMAKVFGQADTLIELSLDDQSDSKALFGN